MNTVFDIENGRLKFCQTSETEIVIPENVCTIGEHVFKGDRAVKKITLPHGLETIEAEAFKGCTSLCEINLPASLTEIGRHAFKGCKSLVSAEFPASLTSVGEYAFHRCHRLRSAILPDSLERLGRCAFLYCDALETVSIGGVKRLETQTFANCTELREIRLNADLETDNLGDDIFTGCVKIGKIALSDGREYEFENLAAIIGTNAHPLAQAVARSVYRAMELKNGALFRLAINLKCFAVPEGVTVIEKSCFYNKKGITRIILPKSLREIKANAFGNCISLEETVFPNDRVAIDGEAFKGCNNLERVILGGTAYYPKKCLSESGLPPLVRRIGEQILSDFYISGSVLMKYRGSEERVCVPEAVTVIAESCFEGNAAVGRVILPDSVREIRENAFRGCVSLQTVALSESIEVIESGAFENCKALLRLALPENVRRLGESEFKRCSKLASFTVNAGLAEIGDMAFYGCKALNSIDIPPRTEIKGRLVFFGSGIGHPPETSELFQPDGAENGIPPYEFCGNSEIVSLRLTEPTVIGKYAFSSCAGLRELEIDNPDCVIGERAFEKCPRLERVSLNVKAVGKGAFSFCGALASVVIDGAEAVGGQAFFGCGGLRVLRLSDSVIEIGARCFEECSALERLDLDGARTVGERAFSRCDGLGELTLGNITVNRRAFEDCSFIKRIALSSDTELKSGAFFGCTNVREIVLDGVSYFPENFSQSVRGLEDPLPERVQEIIASVYSCFDVLAADSPRRRSLTLKKYLGNAASVRIPRDITALGDEAFRNRIRTTEIDIPESVRNIGKLVFTGSGWLDRARSQNALTVVNDMIIDGFGCGSTAVIPARIRRVCSWSFAGNTELAEVKFLGGGTVVDEYAFRNCVGLKRITDKNGAIFELTDINSKDDPALPEYVRRIFAECVNCLKVDKNGVLVESTGNIGALAFVNGIRAVGAGVYKDCNLLREIALCPETEVIGDSAFENSKWLRAVRNAVGVRRIGALAFGGCQSLEDIELSGALEFIGKRAFEHCCALRGILIPEGVRVIPERAFFRCKSLKRVVLPSTLEVIGGEAFAFCAELEEVAFANASAAVAADAFSHCPKLRLCADSPRRAEYAAPNTENGADGRSPKDGDL